MQQLTPEQVTALVKELENEYLTGYINRLANCKTLGDKQLVIKRIYSEGFEDGYDRTNKSIIGGVTVYEWLEIRQRQKF